MVAISSTSGVGNTQPVAKPQAAAASSAAPSGDTTAGAQAASTKWAPRSAQTTAFKLPGADGDGGPQSEAQAKRLAEPPARKLGPNDPVYKFLAASGKLDTQEIEELLSTKGGVLNAKQAMITDDAAERARFFEGLARNMNIAFELTKTMGAWRV